jgi:hypothetical protein
VAPSDFLWAVASPTRSVSPVQPSEAEGGGNEGNSEVDEVSEVDKEELAARLVPRARLLVTHPADCDDDDDECPPKFRRATVYMRKLALPHDILLITFDDLDVSPKFLKIELTPAFIEAMTPDIFLGSGYECPVSERCVAMFPTRCSKAAEGYFYGQMYCGHNKSLLSPTKFVAVLSSKARFPSSFHPGTQVTVTGRPDDEYIFLQFLIAVEPGQSRLYALLGNPAALLPSPTLLHRYVCVSLKVGTEASFEVSSPLAECEPETLARLTEGADSFLKDITAIQLKNKDFGLPKVCALRMHTIARLHDCTMSVPH